jgi:hypothetical protein
MEENMRILNPNIEQLYWILKDLFHFWKSNNWPWGMDKEIRFIFFKNHNNDHLLIDFNQTQEMVVIQLHQLLAYLNFPVELESIYWEYINS